MKLKRFEFALALLTFQHVATVDAQQPIEHLLHMQDSGKDWRDPCDDSIENIVISRVPEIRTMIQYCYCFSRSECPDNVPKDSCEHEIYMQVYHPEDQSSDSSAWYNYDRNFWDIQVGEESIDNVHLWHEFLLNKRTGGIVYYDVGMERRFSMNRYRKTKRWKDEIASMKKWLRTHHCK